MEKRISENFLRINQEEKKRYEEEGAFDEERWTLARRNIVKLFSSSALPKEKAEGLVRDIDAGLGVLEEGLSEKDDYIFFESLRSLNRLAGDPAMERDVLFVGALSSLARSMPLLEKRLKPIAADTGAEEPLGTPECNRKIFESVFYLTLYGDRSEKEIAIDFFMRRLEEVIANIRFEGLYNSNVCLRSIAQIIQWGTKQQAFRAFSAIRNYFMGRLNGGDLDAVAYCLVQDLFPKVKESGAEAVEKLLEPFHVDARAFLQAWKDGYPPSGFSFALHKNFSVMNKIEEERPGIVSFLNKGYGIYDFGRYPAEMLIRQFDESGNDELPYGVVLNPKSDYNGAFYQNEAVWRELSAQLNDAYAMRIFEAESKLDIVRILHSLDRTYGKKQKISFAIIGGHGTENSIEFGGTDGKYMLQTPDLEDKRAKKGGFFVEKPTFILVSCSTGFENGIGRELSRVFGAKVIAPDRETGLKSITALRSGNGLLDFRVEYEDANVAKAYMLGEPAS